MGVEQLEVGEFGLEVLIFDVEFEVESQFFVNLVGAGSGVVEEGLFVFLSVAPAKVDLTDVGELKFLNR